VNLTTSVVNMDFPGHVSSNQIWEQNTQEKEVFHQQDLVYNLNRKDYHNSEAHTIDNQELIL